MTIERVLYTAALALFGGGQFVGVSWPTWDRAQIEEKGRKTAWEMYYEEEDKVEALQQRLEAKVEELHAVELECR